VSFPIKKFLSYYKPYRRLLIADLACASLLSGVSVALPLCSQYVTRNVLAGATANILVNLSLTAALMLLLVLVHTLCNTFVDYRGHVMGSLIERDLRDELFAHYQRLSFSFHDHRQTGQLMTHITTDLTAVSEFYHHGPEDLLIGLLKLIGVSTVLVRIHAALGFVTLPFLPIMAVYAFHFNRKMNAALRTSRARIGDINAQVEDTLAGIRVVQSFANEETEKKGFAHENDRFVASRKQGYRSEAYFYQGMTAFPQILTIAVVILGGAAIASGSLDAADLVTYLLCIGILIEPVQRLVNCARVYHEGIVGFRRCMEVLAIEPAVRDSAGAIELAEVRGRIEFRDVSFRYQEGQAPVLKHIWLDVQAGEYVAVVGPSGIGKTTLCSLLARFYEVTDGVILLDGKDIRDITLRSLRKNIGIAQQDVYLFARTVADNIRYGNPAASEAEIIAAARKANAHDFILRLPHGYHTQVGQRGVRLSGGEKQRLSIARVFLKNPPIVIFDEATSALDYETERSVQEALELLARNRTTLVIAHRLSTVRSARRIVVLGEDGIHEQGTHEELLLLNGRYARLHSMQLDCVGG
jgi:ATP-binding cassette subfamily B protein